MLCPFGCPRFSAVYELIYVYIHIYILVHSCSIRAAWQFVSEIASIFDWQHKFRAARCGVGLHRSLTFPIPHKAISYRVLSFTDFNNSCLISVVCICAESRAQMLTIDHFARGLQILINIRYD